MQKTGIILKGVGSFYYVETDEGVFECRARGIFRKDGQTPLPGDKVLISLHTDSENTIDEIFPRTNSFTRPPIANLDLLVLVVSVCEPKPNYQIIDKILATAQYKDVETRLVITKADKKDHNSIYNLYNKVGISTIVASGITCEGIESLRESINGKVCAFVGNSGVGKSTLINAIDNSLNLETARISQKLGRGKHTTRYIELYKFEKGFIADTPGFASIDLVAGEEFLKEDLHFCFIEFLPHLGKCKFADCSHINTSGCAIIEQLEKGNITESRYESYLSMYDELKDKYAWS